MKRNSAFKVIIVIGVVLLVIGLIVTLIGYLTGGIFSYSNAFHYGRDDSSYSRYWNETANCELWTEESIESVSLTLAYGKIDFVISDTKAGVEIKDYAKDVLTLEMVGSELQVRDNRWTASIKDFNSNSNPVITVYLNQETLDQITIEHGAGTVNLSKVTVDNVYISLGAGDCRISDVDAKSLKLESGAGSATLTGCTVQSLTSSVGAGDISYDGDITQSAKIECGAGNAKFKLAGAESNYSFDVSYGVGTFKLNGHNHSGFGVSETINKNAPVKITVSAGVGDVTVETA